MRARKIAFSLALACAACAGPTDPSTTPPVSVRAADVSAALPPVDPLNAAPAEARLGALVHVLASAQLEGRSVGSAGLGRAEALVRTRLAALGVRPFFPKGFRQRVAFSRRADVEGMATTLFTREGPHTLPELFWPASFSGEGPFSGKLTHFRLDDFIARSVSMMRSVMRSPQGVAGPPREVVHKRVLVLAVTRRPRSPARLDTQTAVLRQGALAAQALGAAAVLYWHNNGSTDAAPAWSPRQNGQPSSRITRSEEHTSELQSR